MAWNDRIDTLKGMFADYAQAAARVTKSAAAVTKSNLSILSEQEKQKKAYLELGKLYYRDYITGEEPDDAEYLPLCDAITECAKNIEALRNELEEAKASFGKPAEEEAPAEALNQEEELANLHKELDELAEELADLSKLDEQPAEAPVFEVVEDPQKPEE